MLLPTLVIALGLGLLGFILSYSFRSDLITGFFYALSIAVMALYGFMSSDKSTVRILVLGLIVFWAWRLSSYLVTRAKAWGNDRRFDGLRDNFLKFGIFWLFQSMVAWLVVQPAVLFFAADKTVSLTVAVAIGALLTVFGVLFEAIADRQKFQHVSADKSGWPDKGLWKYSRHPNYFGEIMVWAGIYVMVIGWLDKPFSYLAAMGPLTVIILLLFISGLPLIEGSADRRHGKDKKYLKYRESTSILIPMPPKKT